MMQVDVHAGQDGLPADLEVAINGRRLAVLGPAGAARELAVLEQVPGRNLSAGLPVLLGSGLGFALGELLARTTGPVAVVDKEAALLAATNMQARFADPRVLFVTEADPDKALARLTHWQLEHGGKPFVPLVHPFYQRLDRVWYGHVRDQLAASASFDFWDKAVQPRFATRETRLLLITSKFFLMGEIVGACKRLGLPTHLLTLEDQEIGGAEFVERLLTAVVTFKPDFVLTMNHLGIDREGLLVDLLGRLRLPLASWFVDNPHLIVHLYARLATPWTTIFTWDADNVPMLRELGFPHAAYLPLGTDPSRFRPRPGERPPSPLLPAAVSFVGNSMVHKVAARMKKTRLPAALLKGYRRTAALFGESTERSTRQFVLGLDSAISTAYENLPDDEGRLAFETLLTWEATRQYRAACVEQLLPFTPLIVGDKGWRYNFRHRDEPWHLHPEVTYYDGLPRIYPFSTINFNCTSKQMKGAVNQRIFDAPAAGGFVLTDWREQMEALFEPGREVISFREPGEVGDLVRYYLAHPAEREQVARAARRRVLAHHTWDHRVEEIVRVMREIYGRGAAPAPRRGA